MTAAAAETATLIRSQATYYENSAAGWQATAATSEPGEAAEAYRHAALHYAVAALLCEQAATVSGDPGDTFSADGFRARSRWCEDAKLKLGGAA